MSDYTWLDRKTPRSVEHLKLWPDNPRLNPEDKHVRISDFVGDLISEDSEKDAFLGLIKSIANEGFRPFDPIVVWKNDDDNYYVAEGNRRVLALKLLLDPNKAPKSIRATVRKYAEKINIESIKKIGVNVAPNFEEAEWYINQRNNAASLRRAWTRTQQQRWLLELYDKYKDDLDVLASKTNFTISELETFLRPLKIRDFIYDKEVEEHLSPEEIADAKSIKFPISILERFFSNAKAREKFKIEYEGINVVMYGDKKTFYVAFCDLIEKIIKRDSIYKDSPTKIDTRTITTNFDNILSSIPEVEEKKVGEDVIDIEEDLDIEEDISAPVSAPNPAPSPSPPSPKPLKNNPHRANLVLSIYNLKSDKTRLLGLFNEFKYAPLSRYPHTLASAMRVFLDLSVLEYIETENLKTAISSMYNADIKDVTLKKRLEYIKTNNSSQQIKNLIGTLLTPGQQFSIDVLNGFVHGKGTHYIDKQFLNKFWDFLFPLFEELLDIEEK